MITEGIKNLSITEKWLLMNDLWDDLAQHPEKIGLSDVHKKILNERYQQFLSDQEEGISWEEAKKNILKSL